MSDLSTALFANSLPVNPIPFFRGLREEVESGGALTSDYAKRILWMLLAIVRGQTAHVNLAGNARIHREDLARLPGRDHPLGVMDAMFREAEGLGTDDIRRNWWSSVASLIFFAWGEAGELSMCDEWTRLYEAWVTESRLNNWQPPTSA